jgi:hypothetical protein
MQGQQTFSTGSFSQLMSSGRPSSTPQPNMHGHHHSQPPLCHGNFQTLTVPSSSQQTCMPAWSSQPINTHDEWLAAPVPALPRSVAALRNSGGGGGGGGGVHAAGRPSSAPDARQVAAAAAAGGASLMGGHVSKPAMPSRSSLLRDVENQRPRSSGGARQQQQQPHAIAPNPAQQLQQPPCGAPADAAEAAQWRSEVTAALEQLGGQVKIIMDGFTKLEDEVGRAHGAVLKHAQQLEGMQQAAGREVTSGVSRLVDAAVAGIHAKLQLLLDRQQAAGSPPPPGPPAAPGGSAGRPVSAGGTSVPRGCSPSPVPSQATPSAGRSQGKSNGAVAAAGGSAGGKVGAPSAAKKRAGGRSARLLQQAASMPGQQQLRFAAAAAPQLQPQPQAASAPVDEDMAAWPDAVLEPEPLTQLTSGGPTPKPATTRSAGQIDAAPSPPHRVSSGIMTTAGDGGSGASEEEEGEEEDEQQIERQLVARLASHRSKRLRRAMAAVPAASQPRGWGM